MKRDLQHEALIPAPAVKKQLLHILRLFAALMLAGFVGSMQPVIAQNPSPTPRTPATAVPTPVPTMVRFTSPVRDQVARGIIEIKGSTSLPNFARYEVSYALESRPNQWVLLAGETAPVNDGALALWNTVLMSNTAYALRLQVYDRNNGVREDYVRNVVISNTVGAVASTASGAASITGVVTGTSSTGVASRLPNVNFADVSQGLTRGIIWAMYGLVALGMYVAAKKIFWFALRRLNPQPIDRGR